MLRIREWDATRSCTVGGLILASLAAAHGEVAAQATELVSKGLAGAPGNQQSGFYQPAISDDGNFVAFASYAGNLVASDTNGSWDVFVHDRSTGVTTRVSVDPAGAEANDDSGGIWGGNYNGIDLSGDGRFVAFLSAATNLVPGDGNGAVDVFVRDRRLGTTTRVSVSSADEPANRDSVWPAISADGRFVAFQSEATNLVPGDDNGVSDVFLHDRRTRETRRVSVDSSGQQGNAASVYPAISSDGGVVGFSSYARNLVGDDGNGKFDVFVHEVATGETARMSVDANGEEGHGESAMGDLSGDGRFVAFSSSSVLVPGDTNFAWDDHVRDRRTGSIERVSVDSNEIQGNASCYGISLSADGRYALFSGYASNLVPADFNGNQDVFLRDRLLGTTTIVSVSSQGAYGNSESCYPAITADGGVMVFTSHSTNLAPGDTNGFQDVFVRA